MHEFYPKKGEAMRRCLPGTEQANYFYNYFSITTNRFIWLPNEYKNPS